MSYVSIKRSEKTILKKGKKTMIESGFFEDLMSLKKEIGFPECKNEKKRDNKNERKKERKKERGKKGIKVGKE
jgi:hypothetical protein